MEEALKLKKATYHLWTFTISKLVGSFGAQVYTFAISFYILQMTGSAKSFAANLIFNILPRILIAPFAGYVADKYSRKVIVITAQIATTMAVGGLLAVTLTSGLSLIAIYATTCVLSITSEFSGVAFSSSITGLVDKPRIQRAMSLNQMSISFAAISSPAIGGLLYGVVSMPVFLIMYITASIVAIVLESTMNFELFAKRQEVVLGKPKEKMLHNMKAGLDYLRSQTVLVSIVWISVFINLLFGAFMAGYAYISIEEIKMAPQHFGVTEGALAVGMLLMSIYLSIRKEFKYALVVGKRGSIGVAIAMVGIALPMLIDMPYHWMFSYYTVVMFFYGLTMIIVSTPIQVMKHKMIDVHYKGRVFSILETMDMVLVPLGIVIYGFLYDVIPAQWVLIVSALMLVGIVLALARPSVVRMAHPELGKSKKRR